MMRVGLLVLAVATTIAIAAPDPKPATWADWTGDYKGPVRWTGCTVTGAATPRLALEFVDGVATIDLAPLRSGLPAVTLVQDELGWAARSGDLAFSVARTKPDTLTLSLEFETGCIARGTLTKVVTQVPACTTLASWARIESKCTKLQTRLEDVAKLAATTWKPSDAAQCTARSEKLALALIDAGCAPSPQPIGTRSKACMALSQRAAKLSRCANLTQLQKNGMNDMVRGLVSASQSADARSLMYVERQCSELATMLDQLAATAKCP